MDNRDDFMSEYTGMTAQRRHRRRTGIPRETEPEEPERGEEALTGGLTQGKPAGEALTGAEPRRDPGEETPSGSLPQEESAEKAAPETPVTAAQGADSRIPAEARRMAAAPYGTAGRDAVRPELPSAGRPVHSERNGERRPDRPSVRVPARPAERAVSSGTEGQGRASRVRVGYAPGRMKESLIREVPAREPEPETAYGRDARAYLEKRRQPFNVKETGTGTPDTKARRTLRGVVAALLILGFALAGFLFLRDRNSANRTRPAEETAVISFMPSGAEGKTAPAVVTFSVMTDKTVRNLRLTDSRGAAVATETESADNAAGKSWLMTLNLESQFDDTVQLEMMQEGSEDWIRTGHSVKVRVASVETEDAAAAGTTAAPETTAEPWAGPEDSGTAEPVTDGETTAGEPEAEPGPGDSPEESAAPEGGAPEETGEAEEEWYGGADATEETETGENPTAEEDERVIGELRTPQPTNTPEPEKEKPTVTPPLTAEAVPEANPDLIVSTEIYVGTKNRKEKTYSRPAKDLISMPVADEYTTKLLGVMTFRGDNFRRNGAVGTLEGAPTELRVKWDVEAGSLRGASQTYYGYGWPGQPAIARWSKQVRRDSNLYETKQSKERLKEVIIAGQDGLIRFLDLDDGSLTRNSIKLGYPMRGTPSLHTTGEPFISVGQFARKMKAKTGRIGLRQYNLYNQKELKLIEGTDGKQHRPLNDIGSFETSALIDRTSDTLITAGSNGAVYLETLDSNFDYNVGVLQISPSVTMMVSRAKGQKNSALTAVESSVAAYDKYIFYADMGGVLRCVDTNTLSPVWAVETGDAVMAAVALDLTDDRELNLYTANMLTNRKKGNGEIQIRRYDALSGREAWCTDIGVYKGKKDKDDVGAKASPVIGLHGLDEYVYFTVTGLSEEGREKLGLNGEEPAALLALEKSSGRVAWVYGLSSRSESSPVAVYDEAGNGWIIQCEQNGTIHMLDGLDGREVHTLKVDGEIEASPAVYNDMMVIGTTGKGTSFVYGIQIRTAMTADEPEQAGEGTEAAGETAKGNREEAPEDTPADAEDYPEANMEETPEGDMEEETEDSEEG